MSVNSKQMVKLGVAIGIAALMASTSIVHANPGGWGGEPCGKHQRHGFREIEQKLGLTDSQKAQAKALFQGNRDQMKPLFTSLHAERKNLQGLIHADTLDEAAIRTQTARIAGIQADLNVNRAKMEAQFRAILTPAQLVILKSMPHKNGRKCDAPPEPNE